MFETLLNTVSQNNNNNSNNKNEHFAPNPSRYCENHPGSNYTEEEWKFGQAIDRYKRMNQRPYPTWSEVLSVVLALGYRLVAEPQPIPKYSDLQDKKKEKEES